MNRRDFLRNLSLMAGATLLPAKLLASPTSNSVTFTGTRPTTYRHWKCTYESPEDRVQRMIDEAPDGGQIVIPRRDYHLKKSWVIPRKSIYIDANEATFYLSAKAPWIFTLTGTKKRPWAHMLTVKGVVAIATSMPNVTCGLVRVS